MADICLKRLKKEYKSISKNPPAFIRAAPLEKNILEWHYVIEGANGTPYAHGWYHGVLLFPKDYPYKPPSVLMYTPNGRFKEATRLCLSMSDYHPELWNTSWSVSTILVGLQSFMNEETPTAGSISTTNRTKRQLATRSMAFNVKNKKFCALFPELLEMYRETSEKGSPGEATSDDRSPSEDDLLDDWSKDSVLLILLAGVIFLLAVAMIAKAGDEM